jgi:ferredoxin
MVEWVADNSMYEIDLEKCNGCANCLETCDVGAIYLVDNKAQIDQSQCTSCGICVDVCPSEAIREEQVKIRQYQPSVVTSLKKPVLSAVKSTAVTIVSTLIPVAISKIGDLIATKLASSSSSSLSRNNKITGQGIRSRKRNRGRGR